MDCYKILQEKQGDCSLVTQEKFLAVNKNLEVIKEYLHVFDHIKS